MDIEKLLQALVRIYAARGIEITYRMKEKGQSEEKVESTVPASTDSDLLFIKSRPE